MIWKKNNVNKIRHDRNQEKSVKQLRQEISGLRDVILNTEGAGIQ